MQTYRDGQIVDWIGRLGAAGAEHVMRRFATSRTAAYDSLGSLVRDGRVRRPRGARHRSHHVAGLNDTALIIGNLAGATADALA